MDMWNRLNQSWEYMRWIYHVSLQRYCNDIIRWSHY